jgi:hypothetical protein
MNKVTCLTCGATIESTFRHDFRGCKCPADSETWVAVDGGDAYNRRCFGKAAQWTEHRDEMADEVVDATARFATEPA